MQTVACDRGVSFLDLTIKDYQTKKAYASETMWYQIVGGVILIIWGIFSLRAFILKKKAFLMNFYDDSFILKKVLGKHYDRVMNLFFGLVEVTIGIFILIYWL